MAFIVFLKFSKTKEFIMILFAVWFISFVLLVTTTVHQTVISIEHLASGYRRHFFVFLGSKTLLTDFQHTKFYPFLNLSFRFILNILTCRKSPAYIFLCNIFLSKERVYSKLICSTQSRHADVQVSSRKKTCKK